MNGNRPWLLPSGADRGPVFSLLRGARTSGDGVPLEGAAIIVTGRTTGPLASDDVLAWEERKLAGVVVFERPTSCGRPRVMFTLRVTPSTSFTTVSEANVFATPLSSCQLRKWQLSTFNPALERRSTPSWS
ncbi:unnamed protein product, partial [Ectocarpus fasciculatus]